MKGVLLKKASDGSWKKQEFTVRKHILTYVPWYDDAGDDADLLKATLNLLDLLRIELKAGTLYLFTDEKRKHLLREVPAQDCGGRSYGPSLVEWELAFRDNIAIAKQNMTTRQKKKTQPKLALPEAPSHLSNLQRLTENSEEDSRQSSEGFSTLSTEANSRDEIIAFYEKHNPDKIDDVDALIIKYSDLGVTPAELHIAIQQKYARRLLEYGAAQGRQCRF